MIEHSGQADVRKLAVPTRQSVPAPPRREHDPRCPPLPCHRRKFALITPLNLPHELLPDVMFLDEPELGLHPHAISLIADMMKRLAQTRQVIIATQPPYLLDQFGLDNVIVTDLVEGATRFRTLDREQYQRWLDDEYRISDIWLKDAVGSQH